MGEMDFHHRSVMPREVLEYLVTSKALRIVDGTLGRGGHSELILQQSDVVEILGIDRDADAIHAAGQLLDKYADRFHVKRGGFADMQAYMKELGWDNVDGILLDLGVSSHQIDTAERGFSHRLDGPLDMRMDRRSRLTAAQVLNTASEVELARIFFEYGEERKSRRIAAAVVKRRQERPWSRTREFAELVEGIVGYAQRLPAATRCFQALRIAVNQELEQLNTALKSAVDMLRPGGRLVVISFHSLEDRAVKHFFREEEKTCVCPPDFPECRCNKRARLRVLTKRPITAAEDEVSANRRAASAKLRAAERI